MTSTHAHLLDFTHFEACNHLSFKSGCQGRCLFRFIFCLQESHVWDGIVSDGLLTIGERASKLDRCRVWPATSRSVVYSKHDACRVKVMMCHSLFVFSKSLMREVPGMHGGGGGGAIHYFIGLKHVVSDTVFIRHAYTTCTSMFIIHLCIPVRQYLDPRSCQLIYMHIHIHTYTTHTHIHMFVLPWESLDSRLSAWESCIAPFV